MSDGEALIFRGGPEYLLGPVAHGGFRPVEFTFFEVFPGLFQIKLRIRAFPGRREFVEQRSV